jgi:hypothetical protein
MTTDGNKLRLSFSLVFKENFIRVHPCSSVAKEKVLFLGVSFFLWFVFGCLALLAASQVQAEEWVFLPSPPLFQPLIGDPREPQTSVIAYTSQTQFEGAVGRELDLVRYAPGDGSQWGWGILGAGFIRLGLEGVAFPMRVNDWYAGMYLSEASGAFSHRLEFVHQSSHLGDSYEGAREPIIYNGENFNYNLSFQPWENLRLHMGLGAWENLYPFDNAFFASVGTEIYSPSMDLMGTFLRGYGTFHGQWRAQGPGSFNKTFQVGLQWKMRKEESRALRLSLIYYNGLSEFGQFYPSVDEHWAVGFYFDP